MLEEKIQHRDLSFRGEADNNLFTNGSLNHSRRITAIIEFINMYRRREIVKLIHCT